MSADERWAGKAPGTADRETVGGEGLEPWGLADEKPSSLFRTSVDEVGTWVVMRRDAVEAGVFNVAAIA